MRKQRRALLLLCGCLWIGEGLPAGAAEQSPSDTYKILPDDTLQMTVVDHPELSTTVTVVVDGTITLPLLDGVEVQGLTISEVTDKLIRLYDERFIADPSISVNLVRARTKRFYVYGEVKMPGMYPLSGGTSTLQAIITAGGFTDYAGRSGVRILRRSGGTEQAIRVNIRRIEKGRMEEDVEIQPDDVIVVPKSWF